MRKGGYWASVGHIGLVLVALAALAGVSRVNFLLFHSMAEMVSVGMAWGVFFIAWNAKRFGIGGFVLVLGIGYFHVGILDLMHMLSYSGLGIAHDGGNAMVQLWIGSRYLEAATMLGALLFLGRRPPAIALHAGLATVVAVIVAAIFVYPVFPDCFLPGIGPTRFKIVSQYVVIAMFAAAAALLFRRRRELEPMLWQSLIGCLAFRILSEGVLSTFAGAYDDINMLGHLLKDVGFYLLYRAVIPAALLHPYEQAFRDRLAARAALSATEKRFRMAIRPTPILVFSQDRLLRYDWVFGGDAIHGRLPRIGQTDVEFLGPEDAAMVDAMKTQVLTTGQGMRRRLCLGRRHRRFFDLNVEPLREADGSTAGIVGTAIDVTELVQARTEAERADQAKSRFLASASHDLRQPFQAMRLFHHMLAERLIDQTGRGIAAKLDEAMAAGEDLLRALLDVSTLEAGTLQPRVEDFPVASVLNQIAVEMEPQAAAKGVRFRVVACAATVRSDTTLLLRVIRNLASNALRYTANGGILIGCRRDGEHLRIVVCDTGIGIDADQLDSIFDDFYQVGNVERDREKGLGLGLSVVQRVGQLLDHPVAVRSVPGRGSTFSITVPCAKASSTPKPAQTGAIAGASLTKVKSTGG